MELELFDSKPEPKLGAGSQASVKFDGKVSCDTMDNAPGAHIKWNGFKEVQDPTNPAKNLKKTY